jgi:phosphoglycerol transferase MdoB-like AlkP superfamily enzyme
MKKKYLIFIVIFTLITLLQVFYWLFANKVEPIIMGMPFAMFVIVSLIIIEFISLLFLYYIDEVKPKGKVRG